MALALASFPAIGSGQPVGFASEEGDLPIEIEAESGIEWHDQYSVVTARGNATATRGDIKVRADTLSAYYREDTEGKTEVWRLEAVGDVHIEGTNENAYADRGTYDVDRAVLVLSGENGVRMSAENGEITARDQIEYWERDRMLVARGDARARQGERGLRADVLVAYMGVDEAGQTQLERVDAFDDVYVYTSAERLNATRGTYSVETREATLTGDVRITRGDNQLNGCRAQVNLDTGVSKLTGCSGPSGAGQVRGLMFPDSDTTAPASQ